MKTRGKWLNKEEWYSICSRAHNINHYDPSCDLCQCGSWRNVFLGKISHAFYVVSPFLWRIWANRKGAMLKWNNQFTDYKSGKKLDPFPNMKVKVRE